MKFRPLHDRVVVERIDAEAKSAGGIIIPDTAKEKPSQGEIIAIGPGARLELCLLNVEPRSRRKWQAHSDRSEGWRPSAVRQAPGFGFALTKRPPI